MFMSPVFIWIIYLHILVRMYLMKPVPHTHPQAQEQGFGSRTTYLPTYLHHNATQYE